MTFLCSSHKPVVYISPGCSPIVSDSSPKSMLSLYSGARQNNLRCYRLVNLMQPPREIIITGAFPIVPLVFLNRNPKGEATHFRVRAVVGVSCFDIDGESSTA